jgi:polyhydroxyalkanoate synthesis regulator phasin
MLKELIYTGLGGAILLKEKVEKELEVLQKEGKIKTDDIKSFLESLENKGKDEEDAIKTKIKDIVKELIDELNIATKDDLEKLKEEMK